jgi:hypothetical protein
MSFSNRLVLFVIRFFLFSLSVLSRTRAAAAAGLQCCVCTPRTRARDLGSTLVRRKQIRDKCGIMTTPGERQGDGEGGQQK